MFELYRQYFCNVAQERFHQDMREKDWAIILSQGGRIVGFSTLQIIRLLVSEEMCAFLFSGDTIVDPTLWQNSTLAGSFGHFMLRLMEEQKNTSLYWFLISKGYRTYRFLPVFFNKFFPVYNQPTPTKYGRLIREIALHKFGKHFDAEAGIISFKGQRDQLKPEMCVIPESRSNDPHVQFFLRKNPNYNTGDELACIADISRGNLNKCAWKVIKNTSVIWNE